MSDLVERVQEAMERAGAFMDGNIRLEGRRSIARAAIREVAEWMIETHSYQAEMIEVRDAIARQLEEK